MRLWRLVRQPFLALDGMGASQNGTRWLSPGRPVVNFTTDPALAIFIVLRYLQPGLEGGARDYFLGWTECTDEPLRLTFANDPIEKRKIGDAWYDSGQSLLARVQSAVVPEADIIMMNVRHPQAQRVALLITRPFSFADCLHCPPLAK